MAKAPLGVEDLNFEQLGDQELREVMAAGQRGTQCAVYQSGPGIPGVRP